MPTFTFICSSLSLYDNPNFIHSEIFYESRQYLLPRSDKNKTWRVEKWKCAWSKRGKCPLGLTWIEAVLPAALALNGARWWSKLLKWDLVVGLMWRWWGWWLWLWDFDDDMMSHHWWQFKDLNKKVSNSMQLLIVTDLVETATAASEWVGPSFSNQSTLFHSVIIFR